jgi:hypothetical protein
MQAKRLSVLFPGPRSDNSASIRIQDIGNLVADGEREVDACSGARSALVFVFSQPRAFSQSTDWNAAGGPTGRGAVGSGKRPGTVRNDKRAAGGRPAAGRHKSITTTVDLYGRLGRVLCRDALDLGGCAEHAV